MDNRIMTEELNNSDTQGDKNWKEIGKNLISTKRKLQNTKVKKDKKFLNKQVLTLLKVLEKQLR
jgi:hypothetical protein